MMADHIEEKNVGSEGTISKEELRKAIAILKSEEEAGHERNLDNMTQEDDNNSPWKEKDAKDATINRMLRFNVHSQHHQCNRDYIKYLQQERDTMI